MKMLKMRKLEKMKRAAMKNTAETGKKKIGVYIPGDIVSEILLRLPARSLGKYRCVCKSWLSITSNTAFVRANAQLNRITRPSVIVGELTKRTKLCLDFGNANSEPASIDLREYQQPTKTIPNHSYATATCDGLVCVMRITHGTLIQFFVINPLTGQSISSPKERYHSTSRPGFYFHRSTSKYRLIRVAGTSTMGASEVLVVGESSWRPIPGNLPAILNCSNPLDLNGNIYWLAFSRKRSPSEDTVVIFDQEQEVYSMISLPPSLVKLADFGRNLADFNGDLGLLVVSNETTIDVWIMEENFWIKRYSVNYAHTHGCSSGLESWWTPSGVFIIGDEELLVNLSSSCQCGALPSCKRQHYLVGCNLKSGASVVQRMMSAQGCLYYSIFSYTETLTNPE
ncbi:F-box protein [Platanthera guangdongensis]|uniref:F-box protein n=1 Tax=Platanthera guangdongensis TaxID=2320717 RepID=A0ABR2MC26_9ASPA